MAEIIKIIDMDQFLRNMSNIIGNLECQISLFIWLNNTCAIWEGAFY